LLAATELPDVVQSCERGMSLIFLPWIDRVSAVGEIGVGGIRYKDRDKSGHILEIAARLGMSESSVKATFRQLFSKTGVWTRSQLVRIVLIQH
jgi:AraC-like DNA-binding protein